MTRTKTMALSLGWNFIGKIGDAAGLFAVNIVVARSLGVHEYGVYAFLMSTAQLVLTLGSAGLDTALTRHIPLLDPGSRHSAIRYLLRRLLILRTAIVLMVFVATSIALGLPSAIPASPFLGCLFLGGFVLFRSVAQMLGWAMIAQLETRVPTIIVVVVRAVEILGVLVLASLDLQILLVLGYLTATGLLQVCLLARLCKPSLRGAETRVPLRPVVTFGGIYFVNVLVDYFLGRYGDVLFLTKLLPESASAGLYDAGAGIVQAAALAATAGFGGVTFALFSGFSPQGGGSIERMRDFYLVLVRVLSTVTIPIFVLLLIDPAPLVQLLFSERFVQAAPVVQVLAGFRIAARLFGGGENAEFLLTLGKVVAVVSFGIGSAVVNIAGDVLLIPHYGAMGAVAATGAANLLVTIGTYVKVRQISGARFQMSSFLRLLTGSGIAAYLVFTAHSGLAHFPPLAHLALYFILLAIVFLAVKPLLAIDLELLERIRPGISRLLRLYVRAVP